MYVMGNVQGVWRVIPARIDNVGEGGKGMFKELDSWSPNQELELLEELAEAEAEAFDVEIDLPIRLSSMDTERPWVAYWHLAPNNGDARTRLQRRYPKLS